MNLAFAFIAALSFVVMPSALSAHGGRLNKCGCHLDKKTNTCHCHRSPRGGCGPACYAKAVEEIGDQDVFADLRGIRYLPLVVTDYDCKAFGLVDGFSTPGPRLLERPNHKAGIAPSDLDMGARWEMGSTWNSARISVPYPLLVASAMRLELIPSQEESLPSNSDSDFGLAIEQAMKFIDSAIRLRPSEGELRQIKIQLERLYLRAKTQTDKPSGAVVNQSAGSTSPRGDAWEILSVDTRVTESNESWSRFAWKLTLKNVSNREERLDATIEFQDKDGFIIETDNQYGLLMPPGSERVFTGFQLIDAKIAGKVAKVNAKVRRRAIF